MFLILKSFLNFSRKLKIEKHSCSFPVGGKRPLFTVTEGSLCLLLGAVPESHRTSRALPGLRDQLSASCLRA
jgi:hypothetical protein